MSGGLDPRLADREARRRIREELDTTLLVEAAAGTGKTTELVARIIAVVRGGAGTLDRIVAVTFTEKAAGELKLRLRGEIDRARDDPGTSAAERRRLDAALEQLEVARVGTIHAFCGDVLHTRPVEAGVDPLFEVAAEEEGARLLDEVFDVWFQRTLDDPPEGVRRLLRRRPRWWSEPGPREQLRAALGSLAEHRDFPAPWRREATFDREARIDRAMDTLAALAELAAAGGDDDWLANNLRLVARFVEEHRSRERIRPRDHDGLEADLRRLAGRRTGWHWRGWGADYAPGLTRAEVIERRNAAKAELDELLRSAGADLAACLHAELRPVLDDYEQEKRRAGKLDFLDLLLRARDLVRDDDAVRAGLQREFTHFFVDEFQDTDPVQSELLLLLAADDPAQRDWRQVRPVPGKLFLVGDPKQSIYRFRRADVALYESIKARLGPLGAEVVHLTTSFRAVPALQEAVNAAFEPVMAGGADGSQASYVPLHRWRDEAPAQPALVALPAPRPYSDWGRVVKWKVEESLADAAAAFVHWLLHDSGWTVEEDGRRVPVGPRHVCLMFRRYRSYDQDVTRPWVAALEARRVPHVLMGGYAFHGREEVLALRNALAAIEWPDDALRVYATLRGPLVALSDDALLAYRHRAGTLHPLRPAGDPQALDSDQREVAAALAILARLHARRNRRPIAATILELLEALRAHAGIAIWPTGEQALANCLRVVDLARRFERGGAPSFRAFVEWLDRTAERGGGRSTPPVEERTDAVRIMTAHAAKGLEFPVVLLADPTCRASRDQATRHVDAECGLWAEPLCGCAPWELLDHQQEECRRDRDEAVRLAYVAATRARDLLVVPAVGDEEIQGWVDVLNPAVYPDTGQWRAAGPAEGCPPFGEESVLERPPKARATASVRPGAHRPRRGGHRVVWWDPAVLDLGRQHQIAQRQQKILHAHEDPPASTRSVDNHERWQRARRQALEAGARPGLVVRTVTAAAEEAAAEAAAAEAAAEAPAGGAAASRLSAPAVRCERVERGAGERPSGKRFGTLVHATLAVVPQEVSEDAVLSAAGTQGRLLGAPEEEVRAAATAVVAVLAHPLMQRARRGTELRHEVALARRLDDGSLIEGVADLAFREVDGDAGRWTVVDFKTDRELGERRDAYERQVRAYAEAIAEATGEPAEGVLLVV